MTSIRSIIENWKMGLIPKTEETELCALYRKYGSDKKTDAQHNYTNIYYPIFQLLRNQQFNFFELGLGSQNTSIPWHFNYPGCKVGASVFAAEEFFPNANIYGADIDSTIALAHDRIKTFHCNTKDVNSIKAMWNSPELKDKTFEIIIDDACHEFDANYCFAVNSIHKLAPRGLFIVEDLHGTERANDFYKISASLISMFNLDIFEILPMRLSNLLLMQKSGIPMK